MHALVGEVAGALSPDELPASLDATLEIIRRAFAADDCEIFLGGPGGEVVLASARGRDGPLLATRPRFAPGAGHPGIVARTARPLLTRALHKDKRYLRKEVPAHGLRASIAVPLLGPGAVLGTLHVYWRRPGLASGPVLRMAEQVARPISTALRAGLARFRERIESLAGDASGAGTGAMLEEIRSVAAARSAALVVFDPGGRAPALHGSSALVCAGLESPSTCTCPVVRQAGSGPEALSQVSCPAVRDPWGRPGCIPLSSRGAVRGVLRLEYGEEAPSPPTRNLVPLLAMAGALASHLGRDGAAPAAPETDPAGVNAARALEVRCFGPFEIRRDGKRLGPRAFVRTKALALFKILLLRGGQPVGRDTLVEQLWPGVGERAGANRLHGVVHALRAALEGLGGSKRSRYVRNEGDQYFFDRSAPHRVDLFAFGESVERGLRERRAGRATEARLALEAAVSACGGELFEDDADPSWCEADRVRLRERRLDALVALAAILRDEGEAELALERLREGLKIDPLREDLHQDTIRLLASLGRRQDALRQYRDCERLLLRELGASPLPETRALIER
ncbi:MAG: BTAD domain-containing putative transcriptional regulator [Myxococcaceae bacterium]